MEDTIALTIWSHWKKQMETRGYSSIKLIDTQKLKYTIAPVKGFSAEIIPGIEDY